MLSGNTDIHILDIETEESLHMPIVDIFDTYIMHADMSTGIIDFTKLNVKIKDWTGWTQLLSIRSIKNTDDVNWKLVTPKDEELPNAELRMVNQILPIYSNSDTTKIGFHGEVKYNYQLIDVNELPTDAMLRAKIPNTINWQRFIAVKAEKSISEPVGFEIVTKSGFFNGGIYLLCSSDTKIDGSKELWK